MRSRLPATWFTALLAAVSMITQATAQMPAGGAYRPPAAFPGVMPAGGPAANAGLMSAIRPAVFNQNLVDAHGNPAVIPAGYNAAAYAQPVHPGMHGGLGGPYMGPGSGNVGYGYAGYGEPMAPCGDDTMDLQTAAMLGYDQCGPHYFDIRIDGMYLTRQETFGRDIPITAFNLNPNDIRLSTGELEYDYEPGFRILGRYDIGPLAVFEFGYSAIYDWNTGAFFEDPNPVSATEGNLFSLFSGLGTDVVNIPNMPETEEAVRHSLFMQSDLQTAELTYRRYWVGYSPRVSGTILAGARYTRLSEGFLFRSDADGTLFYNIDAENDLVGFQTGADMWVCLRQGLRIGAEGKAGIYNNRFKLDTDIATEPLSGGPPTLSESFRGDNVAFIGEGSVDVVADVLPSVSLRVGYEVLWLNSIVLTGNNFNTASPYALPGQDVRVPFLYDQGDALYHGYHATLEYVW